MTNEIKNLKYEFSDIELDLINEFTDQHNGHLKKELRSNRDYFLMSSEVINARFSIEKENDVRTVKVIINSFGDNSDYNCLSPFFLKKVLNL